MRNRAALRAPTTCVPGANDFVAITSIQTLGSNAACNGRTVKIRGIVTGIDDLYGSNFDNIFKSDAGLWVQQATRDSGRDDLERASSSPASAAAQSSRRP